MVRQVDHAEGLVCCFSLLLIGHGKERVNAELVLGTWDAGSFRVIRLYMGINLFHQLLHTRYFLFFNGHRGILHDSCCAWEGNLAGISQRGILGDT